MAGFLSGNNYLSLPRDPQKWVIKDLIPVSGLTNIYGKPKAGKSFAALGMALAVGNGEVTWNSFPVLKHGPVCYIQVDTPRGEWAGRLLDFQQHYSCDNLWVCDMLMTPHYPFNILDAEQVTWLRAEIDRIQPVMVIIDTLRELHPADENDSTQMRNVIAQLVAATRPAALVLLSHARKDTMFTSTGGDDLMNDARGSSYIAGRMDVVVKFTAGCSAMLYKGRSVGQGRLAMRQDEMGQVLLDEAAAKFFEVIAQRVTAMRAVDPGVSVNKMVDDILTHTSYREKRATQEHVKDYLLSAGLAKPRAKTSKKG